ncbi:Lrp/AsnC family transcriptional regulator [Haloarcula amylovorans]|uniref:Lrp/AsnC family transcriptional regulator n=1 Tax=Haloarcula amylovorans TaxID=2562280 RepID=UPI001076963B|nr:Lrp/AsnC family transcriptional regulator [Halomicroarcula amylolytica]
MDYRIDEIDRRILYHLAVDARGTAAPQIAEEVDVTPATIRNRIRQLEEAGVVRGYHAQIDYETIDGRLTMQFTCNAPVDTQSDLARDIGRIPGVVRVSELMAGQQNLLVTVVGTDTDDTARIARQLSDLGVTIDREAIVRDEAFYPYQQFGPEDDTTRTAIRDFQSVAGGAEVVEFTVSEDAAITGATLEEANRAGLLPDEVLVVSIERGDTQLTPKGDTTIEAGDVVSVFSPEAFPEQLVEAFECGDEAADGTNQ